MRDLTLGTRCVRVLIVCGSEVVGEDDVDECCVLSRYGGLGMWV